jgi:hypothetical protein
MTQLYRAVIEITNLPMKIEKLRKANKMTAFPKMTFCQNNILTPLKIEITLILFKLH